MLEVLLSASDYNICMSFQLIPKQRATNLSCTKTTNKLQPDLISNFRKLLWKGHLKYKLYQTATELCKVLSSPLWEKHTQNFIL